MFQVKSHLDILQRRVVISLILLLGVTLLTVGLYNGQLDIVLEVVKRVLEPSVAGAP
jgi:uncharacterized membrane protein YiaA